MNFKRWIYSEMPITNFQLMGNWGQGPESNAKSANPPLHGYNKKDISILTSPKGVEKIHKLWSNTHYEFDFYFLRSRQGSLQREIGQVSPEWIKENLGIEITPQEDRITIIFTNNAGTEKIPMTAWAIAHRLGHAIRKEDIFNRYFLREVEKDFKEILKNLYEIESDDKKLRALAHAVGTMRSARESNLVSFYEFVYELVAQYIITGHIKFNPLPENLIVQRRMAWGRPAHDIRRTRFPNDHEYWNLALENHAEKYDHFLYTVFGSLLNKIFVM